MRIAKFPYREITDPVRQMMRRGSGNTDVPLRQAENSAAIPRQVTVPDSVHVPQAGFAKRNLRKMAGDTGSSVRTVKTGRSRRHVPGPKATGMKCAAGRGSRDDLRRRDAGRSPGGQGRPGTAAEGLRLGMPDRSKIWSREQAMIGQGTSRPPDRRCFQPPEIMEMKQQATPFHRQVLQEVDDCACQTSSAETGSRTRSRPVAARSRGRYRPWAGPREPCGISAVPVEPTRSLRAATCLRFAARRLEGSVGRQKSDTCTRVQRRKRVWKRSAFRAQPARSGPDNLQCLAGSGRARVVRATERQPADGDFLIRSREAKGFPG